MKTRALAALVFGAGTLACGCAMLKPAEAEPRKQVLTQVPGDLPSARPLAATLLVHVPEAKPLYDTTQMAYMEKPYQLDYYSRNEWGDKPTQMIHALLLQTLRNAGYFKEVLAPGHLGPHKYALRSELIELRQDFTTGTPTLRLAMRFQLVDGATNQVKASRELTASEPMKEKSPYAGVVAANEATARILKDAARFALESAG